jgi:hypothetical protein
MIQYWLSVGIDLSNLNVQVLGHDSKNINYLTADVYLCTNKQNQFDERASDIKIQIHPAMPLMRISKSSRLEESVYFLSEYGKIYVININNKIYCYLESSYKSEVKQSIEIIHFDKFKTLAMNQFIKSIDYSACGFGC